MATIYPNLPPHIISFNLIGAPRFSLLLWCQTKVNRKYGMLEYTPSLKKESNIQRLLNKFLIKDIYLAKQHVENRISVVLRNLNLM